jgi:diguanylate cyclase (GGDEF)-like protein
MKILLIENNEAVGNMLQSAIQDQNEHFTRIRPDHDIASHLSNTIYDIVIIDPEDIHNAEKHIEDIAALTDTKVYKLIFSAHYNRIDAHNLGMHDILLKPIDQADLQSKLQQAHIMRQLKQEWTNMKVLLIEGNAAAARAVKRELHAQNEEVVVEPKRSKIYDHLENSFFDVVIMDPTPMNDTQQLMIKMRKIVPPYTYTLLFAEGFKRKHAQEAGMNDALLKPLENSDIRHKIQNARVMRQLSKHLSDISTDFPSKEGIIAKSAFKQLYLTALDRAVRYNEVISILLIGIDNHREITDNDGRQAFDAAVHHLGDSLKHLRRYADILGQTDEHEFSLLLLSGQKGAEPVMALQRLKSALSKNHEVYEGGANKVVMFARGISLPTGECFAHYVFDVDTMQEEDEEDEENDGEKSVLWSVDRLQ